MRKRKWIWLCLWIFSLVCISFYGGAVSYGIFWGMTFLPVVSFVYLLCVYLRFRIYQEIESRQVVCDQPMPYYFVLRNEDRFGFAGICVRMFSDFSRLEDVAEDVEYELLPGDEFLYKTNLICSYRGEYEVGVKDVVLTDFFGIFKFRYPVLGAIRAIVRPKLVELTGLKALSDIVVDLEREAYPAQNEPDVEVREYAPGDSLKKVHWKAAARTGKLWVRKDTGTEKQGIYILFDTCRYSHKMPEYLPLESKLLETLLGITMFMAQKNLPLSVFYQRDRLERVDIAGLKSFEEFYLRTVDMTFDEKNSAEAMMEQVYAGGAWGEAKVLLCVVHRWSEEMMQLAEEMSAVGVYVIVYVVTEDNMTYYVKQNTVRRKVIVVPIHGELAEVL